MRAAFCVPAGSSGSRQLPAAVLLILCAPADCLPLACRLSAMWLLSGKNAKLRSDAMCLLSALRGPPAPACSRSSNPWCMGMPRLLPCRPFSSILDRLRGQHASSLASYHVSICQPCSITRAACITKGVTFRYPLVCSITRAACICLKQIPKMGMCCSIAHAGDAPPNKVDILDFVLAISHTQEMPRQASRRTSAYASRLFSRV